MIELIAKLGVIQAVKWLAHHPWAGIPLAVVLVFVLVGTAYGQFLIARDEEAALRVKRAEAAAVFRQYLAARIEAEAAGDRGAAG